jgi:hypothetical protein
MFIQLLLGTGHICSCAHSLAFLLSSLTEYPGHGIAQGVADSVLYRVLLDEAYSEDLGLAIPYADVKEEWLLPLEQDLGGLSMNEFAPAAEHSEAEPPAPPAPQATFRGEGSCMRLETMARVTDSLKSSLSLFELNALMQSALQRRWMVLDIDDQGLACSGHAWCLHVTSCNG